MLCCVEATLHGIEALPGDSRYTVVFRGAAGDQAAVVEVRGERMAAADASLPDGWTSGTPGFEAMRTAVLALHAARSSGPSVPSLRDVEGGWDVGLGNVVLAAGVPTCTAHGPMTDTGPAWECAECGARAAFVAPSRG